MLAVVKKPKEQYLATKYDSHESQKQELKYVLDSYEVRCEAQDFRLYEVEKVIRNLPSGKKWGIEELVVKITKQARNMKRSTSPA